MNDREENESGEAVAPKSETVAVLPPAEEAGLAIAPAGLGRRWLGVTGATAISGPRRGTTWSPPRSS